MEMTELSPTAEAILEAFANRNLCGRDGDSEHSYALAAALRVVANSVAPEDFVSFTGYTDWDQGLETRNDAIRESLLELITELENFE
jgi:hypothetical protein